MTSNAGPARVEQTVVHAAIKTAFDKKGEPERSSAIESAIEVIASNPGLITTQDQRGFTPLDRASMYGLDTIVKTIVDSGKVTPHDCTRSLFWAAANARKDSTTLTTLLEANADPNARYDSDLRATPLHFAARISGECAKLAIATLVSFGGDPNAETHEGYAPLHLKELTAVAAEALIAQNADVEQSDNFGRKPLHLATQYDHPEVVQTLLRLNADPNPGSDEGDTPLHIAASKGHTDTARRLTESNAYVDTRNSNGWIPLDLADVKQHPECYRMLATRTICGLLNQQRERLDEQEELLNERDRITFEATNAAETAETTQKNLRSRVFRTALVALGAVSIAMFNWASERSRRCELETLPAALEEPGTFATFFGGAAETAPSTLSWEDCFWKA